jgi:hypothetical protein
MRYARLALAGMTFAVLTAAAAPAKADHRGYYNPYWRPGPVYVVPPPRYYYPPPPVVYYPPPYYYAPVHPRPRHYPRSHGAATFYFKF